LYAFLSGEILHSKVNIRIETIRTFFLLFREEQARTLREQNNFRSADGFIQTETSVSKNQKFSAEASVRDSPQNSLDAS
jgi:hypothetical protein